jgi:predicted ATPase
MLISFIGAPCSGKTTSAARLFADLKDLGYPAEFVAEAARLYIAKKKNHYGDTSFSLSDVDQLMILSLQKSAEETMNHRGSLVVTDSSVFNTLLYLSDESQEDPKVREDISSAKKRYDLIFRCPPVKASTECDPNRVHSFEESLGLNNRLTEICSRYEIHPILLGGTTRQRVSTAMEHVLGELLK